LLTNIQRAGRRVRIVPPPVGKFQSYNLKRVFQAASTLLKAARKDSGNPYILNNIGALEMSEGR
jgi:hypothetical protein